MGFKTAAVLVGAAFLFAGVSPALAKSTERQFSGELKSLDSAAKTLIVKSQSGKKEEMSFSLATGAKIMQGTSTKSLDQLKVGERVKVSYTDEGAKHQAQRIDLLAANVAKAKTASPASKSMTKD